MQVVRPEDAAVFSRLIGIMREGLASPDIDDPDAETQLRVLQAVISLQAGLILKMMAFQFVDKRSFCHWLRVGQAALQLRICSKVHAITTWISAWQCL